jgi:hypothetical protein
MAAACCSGATLQCSPAWSEAAIQLTVVCMRTARMQCMEANQGSVEMQVQQHQSFSTTVQVGAGFCLLSGLLSLFSSSEVDTCHSSWLPVVCGLAAHFGHCPYRHAAGSTATTSCTAAAHPRHQLLQPSYHLLIAAAAADIRIIPSGVTPPPPSTPPTLSPSPSPSPPPPAPSPSPAVPPSSTSPSPAPPTTGPSNSLLPKGPLNVAYYETWSAAAAASGAQMDLARIPGGC